MIFAEKGAVMITFPSDAIYRVVAIMLDCFAASIFVCILVTFRGVKAKNTKNKYLFLACTVVGLAGALADAGSYVFEKYIPIRWAYVGATHGISVLIIVFFLLRTLFILSYLETKSPWASAFKHASILIYIGLILAHCISPIVKNIYYVAPGGLDFVQGPYYDVFRYVLAVAGLSSALPVVINAKKLGWKDTVLLLFFIANSALSYIFLWDEVAPSLLLMTLAMLIIYISFYQGRALQAIAREKELAEKKVELSDMRTKLVLSQVQPHFMYNTLSSIAYYCKKDAQVAQNLTLDFSAYLRNNIDSLSGESMVLFSREIENVKHYLDIEKVRFGDRLHIVYDIQFDNFAVPALLLQPIVENAVKHGVCRREEGGTVRISSEKTKEGILIRVVDDGVGFDLSKVGSDGKNHVGIANVRERLEELCGGHMTIESTPGRGTAVTLNIPLEVHTVENLRN